jgi:hypothetical protein
LEQTDALLNKYISILSKSEDFSRLIFDERWQGAEAVSSYVRSMTDTHAVMQDEAALERDRSVAEERARREATERALSAQRERERQEREEQERLAQEEKERVEREKREKRGAIRGVRGTRASTRGAKGTGRGMHNICLYHQLQSNFRNASCNRSGRIICRRYSNLEFVR